MRWRPTVYVFEVLPGGTNYTRTAFHASPEVLVLQVDGVPWHPATTSASVWPANTAPAALGGMNGGSLQKSTSADTCPLPSQPSRSVKRSSVQRCSALNRDAASADAATRSSDDGVTDGIGGAVRTSARLTQWKRAAMADCAAADKLQYGANNLQVLLGLQPVQLTSKQRTGGVTRSASGASRRIGSLTNGLP